MDMHQENIYSLLDSALRLASSKTLSIRLWGRVEQRQIKYVGWHLLVMSQTRPDNSEWMLWDDGHYINEGQLVRILRFESAPDTLEGTASTKTAELERLKTNWKQIIELAPDNIKRTPAAALLASAGIRPIATENNTVVLASTYSFHKEQLEKAGNREVAEKIISNFLGHPCHVRCVCEKYGHLVKAALRMGAEIIDKEAEMVTEKQAQLFTEAPNNSSDKTATEVPSNMTAHAPYYLADGTIVPGVTTVLNILDKPGLPHWAWELGQQGLDYREVRDAAARVGTITHRLIAARLKGEPREQAFKLSDVRVVALEEAEKAENCFLKYLAWEKENPISPVMIEEPLVSEQFRFGGTPDLLAEFNGEFVLIDFKTGNGIYESYFYQLAAYRQLLIEQGWPVARAWILRISPNDNEYEVAIGLDLDHNWAIFKCCLEIYRLRSQ